MSMPSNAARPFGPRRTTVASAISDVERLLAYEEIRQLAARYALAMDRRDLDYIAELFVDDVRGWDGSTGRSALRKQLQFAFRGGMAGRVSFAHIGTHVINLVDADRADGTVYCIAEFGGPDRWVRQAIAYEDTYERREGAWYFATRDHHLFYGADADLTPLDQEAADWPKSVVGVGTVPYVWPSWQEFVGDVTVP